VYLQSLIDDSELEGIQAVAARVKEQMDAGRYGAAFNTFASIAGLVSSYTHGVDWYNFLVFHGQDLPISKRKRTLLNNGEYSL